jgi:protein-disulfide isomerase
MLQSIFFFAFAITFLSLSVSSQPIPTSNWTRSFGDPGAPIFFNAFIDYQCPDSKEAWPVLNQLYAHYGASNMYFVVNVFPLPYHHNAVFASQAAILTANLTNNPATYWDMANILFDKQDQWGDVATQNMTALQVIELLGTFAVDCCGVTLTDFVNSMGWVSPSNMEARHLFSYGASLGIYGTPQYRVNNVFVPAADQSWGLEKWIRFLDPLLPSGN